MEKQVTRDNEEQRYGNARQDFAKQVEHTYEPRGEVFGVSGATHGQIIGKNVEMDEYDTYRQRKPERTDSARCQTTDFFFHNR